MRAKVIEELDRLPTDRLTEIYDLIHYYRLGIETTLVRDQKAKNIMSFAGSWEDMSEDEFSAFIDEVRHRRRQAFTRRRADEPGTD